MGLDEVSAVETDHVTLADRNRSRGTVPRNRHDGRRCGDWFGPGPLDGWVGEPTRSICARGLYRGMCGRTCEVEESRTKSRIANCFRCPFRTTPSFSRSHKKLPQKQRMAPLATAQRPTPRLPGTFAGQRCGADGQATPRARGETHRKACFPRRCLIERMEGRVGSSDGMMEPS